MLDLYYKTVLIDNKIKKDVVLSPGFGLWSQRVGGAEADIYIDGGLYDFKARMDTGYHQQDVMQLWGYYLLHQMNIMKIRVNSLENDDLGEKKIDRLCIYYSRYGVVHSCPVSSGDTETLDTFADLIKSATQQGID